MAGWFFLSCLYFGCLLRFALLRDVCVLFVTGILHDQSRRRALACPRDAFYILYDSPSCLHIPHTSYIIPPPPLLLHTIPTPPYTPDKLVHRRHPSLPRTSFPGNIKPYPSHDTKTTPGTRLGGPWRVELSYILLSFLPTFFHRILLLFFFVWEHVLFRFEFCVLHILRFDRILTRYSPPSNRSHNARTPRASRAHSGLHPFSLPCLLLSIILASLYIHYFRHLTSHTVCFPMSVQSAHHKIKIRHKNAKIDVCVSV